MQRTLFILLSFLAIAVPAAAVELLSLGQSAPEFELPDQDGQLHSLEDYRDQWVVLYFYPKDETPGCTTEACEFRDNIFAFKAINAQILGVSLDDVESHQKFAERRSNLPSIRHRCSRISRRWARAKMRWSPVRRTN
jgi:peroxiredoxin Q/BCP